MAAFRAAPPLGTSERCGGSLAAPRRARCVPASSASRRLAPRLLGGALSQLRHRLRGGWGLQRSEQVRQLGERSGLRARCNSTAPRLFRQRSLAWFEHAPATSRFSSLGTRASRAPRAIARLVTVRSGHPAFPQCGAEQRSAPRPRDWVVVIRSGVGNLERNPVALLRCRARAIPSWGEHGYDRRARLLSGRVWSSGRASDAESREIESVDPVCLAADSCGEELVEGWVGVGDQRAALRAMSRSSCP